MQMRIVSIISLIITLFTLNALISHDANADTKEFVELLNEQKTDVERAVVCYRVWSIWAGAFELDFKNTTQVSDEDIHRVFQTKVRALFLEQLSKQHHLEKLLDIGYEYGANMPVVTNHPAVKKYCIDGVNALMNSDAYAEFRDISLSEGKKYVQNLVNKSDFKGVLAFTATQYQIIREVIAANGFINKAVHKRFWDEMQKARVDTAEFEKYQHWLFESLRLDNLYQHEVWKSVLLSYQAQEIRVTLELRKTLAESERHVKYNSPYKIGSPEYEIFINSYKLETLNMEENLNFLLKIAAERGEITAPEGYKVLLSEELINYVINNLDSSFVRLKKLIDPEWHE